MDFALTDGHRKRLAIGTALGRALPADWAVDGLVQAAADAGWFAAGGDGAEDVLQVEALAAECPGAAVAMALHTAGLRSGLLRDTPRTPVALALTADSVPLAVEGRLVGRAAWVAPLTARGSAIVGIEREGAREAALVSLDAAGIRVVDVEPSGLRGLVCGHLELSGAAFEALGSPQPVMAWARTLLAAVGVGVGRRALREALGAAEAYGRSGPGGEQTLQGLIADAATELDAARLVVLAAAQPTRPSLADASMAKLLSTEAAQRAVLRATQVVGLASFERGHVLEQMSHDVRALELFAGRTEALRDAVAERVLSAESP